MPIIKIETYEKGVFNVELDVAKKFGKLVPMLGQLINEDKSVPLKTINAATMRKIIEWCTKHKDDPVAPEDDDNKMKQCNEEVCTWDDKFCHADGQSVLFDVISAAHTLEIEGLLDVACKAVANMIKGKSPEEIRKTFNIKNDFTQQEEDQLQYEDLKLYHFGTWKCLYSTRLTDPIEILMYPYMWPMFSTPRQIKKENDWCED